MKAYCVKKVGQMFRKTKVAAATLCVGAAGLAAVGPVWAQATKIDVAPSEKAKRDAEKVFSWMKISSAEPKKAPATPAAPPVVVQASKDDKSQASKASAAKPGKADPAADAKAVAIAETLKANPPAAGAAPGAVAAAAPQMAAAPVAAAAMGANMPSAASSLAPASTNAGAVAASLAAPVAAVAKIPEPALDELIPVAQGEPSFPNNIMRNLRQGRVQVTFDVKPDGTVGDVRVASTSSSRLNSYAVAAVQEWRFKPISRSRQATVELGFDME